MHKYQVYAERRLKASPHATVGRILKNVWRRRSNTLETKLKAWKALLNSYNFNQLNVGMPLVYSLSRCLETGNAIGLFFVTLPWLNKFNLILSVYNVLPAALDQLRWAGHLVRGVHARTPEHTGQKSSDTREVWMWKGHIWSAIYLVPVTSKDEQHKLYTGATIRVY